MARVSAKARAIARGRAYAPYADLVWCETSRPKLEEARKFAEGIHEPHPGKLLAYNCSPSFNWKAALDDTAIARFQRELGAMGYRFQFITLAGFHALNTSMFELAQAYRHEGMTGYVRLQQREFELEREHGYSAVKHQRFVGTGYFDEVATVVSGGTASTSALRGSTEEEQFAPAELTAAGRTEAVTVTGQANTVTVQWVGAEDMPEAEPEQALVSAAQPVA